MRPSRREVLGIGAALFLPRAAPQAAPEPYLTPQEKFRDVSRGKPLPHKLPPEKMAQVGMTRESWRLEIVSDPDHPAALGKTFTKEKGTALDWDALMKLSAKRSVSFVKIMTCNNIGRPLGTGLWQGAPLRDLVWLAEPREDLRRVHYYGYHNDDPAQMFRSSLPIGRVLEDPPGMPPVIVCTRLNGRALTPERGGPVRIVVPEAYGFKSIKWLSHLVLSNLAVANDTYIGGNNDIDSPLKTYARTLSVPREFKAGEAFRVTGLAQVGMAGLSKVQVWVAPGELKAPEDDPYFTRAPWQDAEILPPPAEWGGDLPEGRLPSLPLGFDPATGKPKQWPMPYTKAHWTAALQGLVEGKHVFRCRTIDGNGVAQPMPRPFAKSGHASIEAVPLVVKG